MINDKTILKIKKLTKEFKKGFKVVDNLSLEISEGDVFGLIGPNGAGKTTTIRMILGLIKPDKGHTLINNYSIKNEKFLALNEVGALIEGPAFYPYLSAFDNLKIFAEYSGGVSESRINELLKFVGLEKRAKDKVGDFSLGMKQRLGIAQALLNKPKLLILDEPTNGLDPYGVLEVREMIKTLSQKEKVTIFFSSHILTEVEHVCNKIAIINKGKLVTKGNVKDLLNSEKSLYEIEGIDIDLDKLKKISEIEIINENPLKIKIKNKPEKILKELMKNNFKITKFNPLSPNLEDFFFNEVK